MEECPAWIACEGVFTMDMAGGIRWLGCAGKVSRMGWLRHAVSAASRYGHEADQDDVAMPGRLAGRWLCIRLHHPAWWARCCTWNIASNDN